MAPRKLLFIVLFLWLIGPANLTRAQQMHHEVFLANTDHELHVYRINGDEPGKTIMLIGGIQGDEPGGYLTADLYADIHLQKGNLIVVPRANFYSILLNQRDGLTGDMNRKFDRHPEKNNLENEIVVILKHLIFESDCLLNLHEGSGYYSPEWKSDSENPQRYGQSIIYDTAVYTIPDTHTELRLEELANNVLVQVNRQIANQHFQFKLNNHDTLSAKTLHPEQRKSATFYALTRAHIPSFGVETSKSIESLADKIHLQKLVINTFMKEFGIIMDTPGVIVDQPQLNYLLVKVNNGPAYALANGARLDITAGDDILITDIIANYPRGLVADIIGMGSTNDRNIPFRISRPTRIVVRKDALQCGWVDIVPAPPADRSDQGGTLSESDLHAEEIIVNVNGKMESLAANSTLAVPRGARLILRGVKTNNVQLDGDVFLNFKGFAPPKATNDGNDLHFPIYTDQDLWPRYSENCQGKRYPIEAIYKDKHIGKFWIELANPR
jgi:hypothetical protein